MLLRTIGKTVTPIIKPRRSFMHTGVRFTISGCPPTKTPQDPYRITPRITGIGKIIENQRRPPKTYRSFYGYIYADYMCKNMNEARRKLKWILKLTQLGKLGSEGMGMINWSHATIIKDIKSPPKPQQGRIKIRKGIPKMDPKSTELLMAILLHDFVHNELHRSKIYKQITIENPRIHWLAKNHHKKNPKDPQLKKLQHYDRVASAITRKWFTPTSDRYRPSEANINFKRIATEIEEIQHNPQKLYQYIYQSKDLAKINESMQHVITSLRKHLLIATNFFVSDWLKQNVNQLKRR